jgi:energy-coupling factor transport system substrate-specific component
VSSTDVALALVAALALGLVVVETGPNRSRELALVAALAAAAAGGRVLFAALPNVQPVTMVVAITGVTLGARAGLATGATAALASNVFLGQGPWTPWQMAGWGIVGLTAAAGAPLLRNRVALAAFGLAWGFLFDWLMDVWAWTSLGAGATSFAALVSTGIWFDVAHAAGNVLLALVAGPTLIHTIDRYARKLHGTFVPLEQT